MKNKYLITILNLILVVLILSNSVLAQNVQNQLLVVPKSPEAVLSDKNSNFDVNTSVGIPFISIPIYTLTDKNIKIPISLSYNASGVRVDDISTPVGLNWSLNAGGMISRNIIGIADEKTTYGWLAISTSDGNPCLDDALEGFYKGLKDPAPDVFYYNFMGKSGSFFYDKNRVLHKSINDGIKIETPLEGKPMKAWDEQGNCYYFELVDYTSVSPYDYRTSGMREREGSGNTGWHLTRIVTPTNEVIYFYYDAYTFNTDLITTSWTYSKLNSNGTMSQNSQQSKIYYDTYQLSSIQGANQTILFDYEVVNSLSIMKKRLKSISVIEANRNIEVLKVTLNHVLNSRIWLSDVNFSGKDNQIKKKYSFKYKGYNLPNYGSYQRDIFGYYNNNQQSHMIPVESQHISIFDGVSANREVDTSKITTGVLNEMIYPTGGRLRFSYEPNFESTANGDFYAPGIRVKTIEHLNENEQLVKKEIYEYSDLTGDYLHKVGEFPFHYLSTETDEYFYNFYVWSSSPIQSLQSKNQFKNGFLYKNVKIKNYDGMTLGSFIIEKYEKFPKNFDIISYPISQEFYKSDGEIVKKNTFNYDVSQVSILTGRTLNNSYIFKNSYTDCNGTTFTNSPSTPPSSLKTHYLPLSPLDYQSSTILKTKETTTSFFNNMSDSLYSETLYEYNDHYLPSKVINYYSPNHQTSEKKIKEFKYSTDYSSNDTWITQMKNNYIIGKPIDIRTYKRFGNQDNLIEGKTQIYNGSGQIIKNYTLEAQTPSTLRWDPISVLSAEFYLKNEFQYEGGNLVQSTTLNNQKSSVVWGYYGTLPVVKVENISHDILESAVISAISSTSNTSNKEVFWQSLSDIATNVTQQDIWKNFNTALRNNSQLSNSLITTYTYTPLVGMTSQADPKGQITFYQYDSYGQLKAILDGQRNIVKAFSYNYANSNNSLGYSNSYQSQVFSKNNCPSGARNSLVYEVPAHTYFSTISQADADQKALDDIALNGQNYVNKNVECKYYNTTHSQNFTKNNCTTGGTGLNYTYTVVSDKYSSNISQADADQKALDDIALNGQRLANELGQCIYYNSAMSRTFTKLCLDGYASSTYTYNVPAAKYSSYASQSAADEMAENEITYNGQNFANQSCTCSTTLPFAALDYENVVFTYSGTYADIWVKFYENSSQQTPRNVNNLSVDIKESVYNWYQEGYPTEYFYNYNCSGTYFIMGYQILLSDPINEQGHDFSLIPSSNYVTY